MKRGSYLHEDRFFDPEPAVRKIARQLYEGVKDMPIVSPHGHTDANWFAENSPFSDPTALFLIPDHYVFRMLHSQGIPMEALGVPAQDKTKVEGDHRKIWQLFADHVYLFRGTPTDIWLTHAFSEVFGIDEILNTESALRIYDYIDEQLKSESFLPRALFDRFNIEVLTTTDAAEDSLSAHQSIRESDWEGRIIPCFRPDNVTKLLTPGWKHHIEALGRQCGFEINSFREFIQAIEDRRTFFKSMGAVSTDQGVLSAHTARLENDKAEAIFQRALAGVATSQDASQFTAHMLMEMARMSIEDGLIMQIHPGSLRNHNRTVFDRFGADKGCDIPIATEYTRNLYELLNAYGNDSRLTLILFTLDESTYSRELAPLAGHYPAVKLGPSWWFHDSLEGMTRFRQQVTETAGIYNTAGFNDDTRAFPSIPARHDLSRRVDSNFLARLVSRHIVSMESAREMSRALAYDLVKKAYKL